MLELLLLLLFTKHIWISFLHRTQKEYLYYKMFSVVYNITHLYTYTLIFIFLMFIFNILN